MGNESTLNVRFPGELRELKKRGDMVLAREGISTSQAVRQLYKHLDETQRVPEWMHSNQDIYEQRRQKIHSLVGVVDIDPDFDARTIKDERLSRLEF